MTAPPTPADAAALRGDGKRAFVRDVFDRLAPRYDGLNLVISLGQTTLWRARAFSGLELRPGARVLDVGCGTGVSVRALRARYPGVRVEGLDLSEGMIEEARRRDPGGAYEVGDVTALPHGDAAFDLVTTVYTTRNFPDLDRALDELVRVTRPGGRVLVLDSFPPRAGSAFGALHATWLREVVPRLVAPFADRRSFEYLAESILRHVEPEELAARFRRRGCDAEVRSYSLGAATRVLATRRQSRAHSR